MLKISTRISLFYLTATSAIIILMAISMYYIYFGQRLQSIDSELKDYSNFLTSDLKLEHLNLSYVFDVLNEKKDYSKPRLSSNYQFVLADNDSIIYESNNSHLLDSLIKQIIYLKNPTYKPLYSTLEYNKQHFRTYSKIIHSKKNGEIELIMIASLERFYESLNQLMYILFVISPGFLLIAALIGSFIARQSYVPVSQIINAAEKITAESLDQRVAVRKTNDELTHLATAFNDMIDRLDKTFKSQKQFIADASHDFRTPLTILRLEFEILLSGNNINEATRYALTKSLQEVKSLSTLADNLLLLARADSNQLVPNKEKFRFDELLLESIGNFNILSKLKGVTFKVYIDNICEINADMEMIKRVLNNLLDNAVKYSLDNSIISVTMSYLNKTLNLEITNRAEHIPPEVLILIFDRFQRAQHSRTNEGFGLGLPIVKAIVKAHNGTVNFSFKENIFSISTII